MKKLLTFALLAALALAGCKKDRGDSFVAVTGITGVATATVAGTPLALAGTVEPGNATNQAIAWSVADAGTTGATISGGNTLNTAAAGTATVRATIANGKAEGTDYTQDFEISVASPPDAAYFGSWIWMKGSSWVQVTITGGKLILLDGDDGYTLENITWTPVANPYGDYTATHPTGYKITGTLTALQNYGVSKADESGESAGIGEQAADWWYIGADKASLMRGYWDLPGQPASAGPFVKTPLLYSFNTVPAVGGGFTYSTFYHGGSIYASMWSLAAPGMEQGKIWKWNRGAGGAWSLDKTITVPGITGSYGFESFTSDGTYIYAATEDETIWAIDPAVWTVNAGASITATGLYPMIAAYDPRGDRFLGNDYEANDIMAIKRDGSSSLLATLDHYLSGMVYDAVSGSEDAVWVSKFDFTLYRYDKTLTTLTGSVDIGALYPPSGGDGITGHFIYRDDVLGMDVLLCLIRFSGDDVRLLAGFDLAALNAMAASSSPSPSSLLKSQPAKPDSGISSSSRRSRAK